MIELDGVEEVDGVDVLTSVLLTRGVQGDETAFSSTSEYMVPFKVFKIFNLRDFGVVLMSGVETGRALLPGAGFWGKVDKLFSTFVEETCDDNGVVEEKVDVAEDGDGIRTPVEPGGTSRVGREGWFDEGTHGSGFLAVTSPDSTLNHLSKSE